MKIKTKQEQPAGVDGPSTTDVQESSLMGEVAVIEIPSEGHSMMTEDEAPSDDEIDAFFALEPVVPESGR